MKKKKKLRLVKRYVIYKEIEEYRPVVPNATYADFGAIHDTLKHAEEHLRQCAEDEGQYGFGIVQVWMLDDGE